MQKIITFFQKHWPIIVIVVFTIILRVIRLEELFYFTYDESVPAFVGRRILLEGHVPLIGGVTPFGVHLAPYFYWFLSSLLIIGKLNPLVWGITGAFLAAFTTLGIFILGSKINNRLGFTAAVIWALSFITNVYDRHLWALYLGPLVSILTIYSLYKIIKGQDKYVLLLSITLIIGVSADPSNLVFLLLSIIAWVIYKIPITKNVLIGLILFIASLLPLIAFDLRHNFANSKPFIEFWQKGNNNPGISLDKLKENSLLFPRTLSRLILPLGDNDISTQYSYSKEIIEEKYNSVPLVSVVILSVLIILFLYKNYNNRKNKISFLISLLFLIYFAGIHVYGSVFKADIFEHYITGLFTSLILIFSYFVSKIDKKIWLIILIIFSTINLYKFINSSYLHGLKNKRLAIEYAMNQVGKNDFSIDSISTNWMLSGYRYLFTIYGREPVKSYVDSNFGYLYGTTEISLDHPDTMVTFVIHTQNETDNFYKKYANAKANEISSELFGNIEVIIVDNSL